eukprot:g11183.t1
MVLWTPKRKSRKAILYDGAHERHAIIEFVHKQLEQPARKLTSVAAVENFVKDPRLQATSTAPDVVTVVGFFSDAGGMEEDEMEDFVEAAGDLKTRSDVYFGVVDDAAIYPHRGSAARRPRIGGTSGGVSNDELVKELEEVALEHKGRLTCLYADGIALADSMKTLGLFGSRERLPQVGFNTMDGRQLPFPEDLPINRETLLHFAAAFLSGRLQSAIDARKAMVVSRPFSTHNTVWRKEKRGAPAEVRGVSEQLKPKDAITQVTRENFAETVLDTDKDVLLMFHAERVGERFLDLGIPSVLVAAMDVTMETPPPELAITLPTLPAIVLLPGDEKGPPLRFFSGVGKVGPLMRWLREHSSTPFDLPALPHLSEEDKPLFRQQVRERQELQAARAASQS